MSRIQENAQRAQIAGRCIAVFAILALVFFYQAWAERQRLVHNAVIATQPVVAAGVVTCDHTGKGGRYFCYRYTDADNVSHQEISQGSTPFPSLPNVGVPLTVVYARTHPQWSVVGSMAQQPGSRVGVFMVLALLSMAIALYAWRKRWEYKNA